MEFWLSLTDFFAHMDTHVSLWFERYGALAYLILFLIILCENGVIFAVFLPGDSLVITAGALCASGHLHTGATLAVLFAAALGGYFLNYATGRFFGRRILRGSAARFVKPQTVQKTERFFHRHGARTVLWARFVPFVRTFASFIAGMGGMQWGTFALFNAVGSALWVCALFGTGYFLGGDAFLRGHWHLLIPSLLCALALAWGVRRALGRGRGVGRAG